MSHYLKYFRSRAWQLSCTFILLAAGTLIGSIYWVSHVPVTQDATYLDRRTKLIAKRASFYQKPTLRFEANQGEADGPVQFRSRAKGYDLFLTPTEALLAFHTTSEVQPDQERFTGDLPEYAKEKELSTLRMRLLGGSTNPYIYGVGELTGKSSYFIGRDEAKWRSRVTSFGQVVYENVYPGIDLAYYGNEGNLEYDFVLSPSADPRIITVEMTGVSDLKVDSNGDLVLSTNGGQIKQHKPFAYQIINGREIEISASYVVKNKNQFTFHVGPYDETNPLTIDPVLNFSTYLGGSGIDTPQGIAVDSQGNAYIAGYTPSIDFPVTGGVIRPTLSGEHDVFITKLSPTGALLYSTFLGGHTNDFAFDIAVDAVGNAYITGFTASSDFPNVDAVQQTLSGGDAFISKLDPTGSALLYSTFYGGSSRDSGEDIAADSEGNAYVVGRTSSDNFTVTPGAFRTQRQSTGGGDDAFLTKLNTTGRLGYSTYIGTGTAWAVAVNDSGHAYVAGETQEADFPTTTNAIQQVLKGSSDAFVAAFDATGSNLIYSTYLGGGDIDYAQGIALDAFSCAYVTGRTYSSDLSTVNATQGSYGGQGDAFIAKLDSEGAQLSYLTYIGGAEFDEGTAIAVDSDANAFITGQSASKSFPISCNALQPVNRIDSFITRLNSQGILIYSTNLGGGDLEVGLGIGLDGFGSVYLTGLTGGADFPILNAFQPAVNSNSIDGFVMKLDLNQAILPAGCTPTGDNVTVHLDSSITLTFDHVLNAGTTIVSSIDPVTAGEVPGGFAISSAQAYQMTTSAELSGSITIAFVVRGPISLEDFNNLSVLQNENGVLVDVTASTPVRDYSALTIYADTNSLSSFYVVRKGEHVKPLFDQTKTYRSGSTILIKIQLLNGSNTNISSANTTVTARNLVLIGGTTNVLDFANAEHNFRYDSTLGGLGGGYVFNLSTKGLTSGQYVLGFYVGSDRTFFYQVKFEVK